MPEVYMTIAAIWFFVVPFALAAALPGPAQGALVAKVLAHGGASTSPFVTGMVMGNAVWLLAAIFGLSTLALRFESTFLVVKWLGVAYLVFIAWNLWRAQPDAAAGALPQDQRGLLAGAALTLGNPKAVVFRGSPAARLRHDIAVFGRGRCDTYTRERDRSSSQSGLRTGCLAGAGPDPLPAPHAHL
jgi:threonine/homoserine/homoserine lactone efflux protein